MQYNSSICQNPSFLADILLLALSRVGGCDDEMMAMTLARRLPLELPSLPHHPIMAGHGQTWGCLSRGSCAVGDLSSSIAPNQTEQEEELLFVNKKRVISLFLLFF